MLYLRAMGGLSLDKGGRPVTGPAAQRRRLVLLTVLALSAKRGISRDTVLALFWPESDAERARGALKQTLYSLRRDLGEPELTLGVVDLRLNPDVIGCDAIDFEMALDAGDVQRAVGTYRGALLDGVHVAELLDLERWIERERARLDMRHRLALRALADGAEQRGDQRGAIEWWRNLVSCDPLSASAATGFMRALIASGDSPAALHHAHEYERLVRDELDAAPDSSVTALVDTIRTAPLLHDVAQRRPAEHHEPRPPLPSTAALRLGEARRTRVPRRIQLTEPMDERRDAMGTDAGEFRSTTAEEPSTLPSRPSSSRSRVAVAVAAVFLAWSLAAYSAMRFVQNRSTKSVVGSGREKQGANPGSTSTIAAKSRTMLVTDFRSAPEDSGLARTTTDVLRIALGQSGLVRVLSQGSAARALQRMRRAPSEMIGLEAARAIARREGISVILDGTLSRSASALLITARIIAADSETILAASSETAASPAKLPAAADALSRRLRIGLGESVKEVADTPPLARVTTASFEALEDYTVASRANAERDFPRAVTLLKEAVAIDSEFASAWLLLSTALVAYGPSGYLASPAATADAQAHAFRYRERLPRNERLMVEGGYYGQRDRGRAIAAYEEALAHGFPGSGAKLGELLNTRREYTRSEQILRSVWTPGEPPPTDLIISLLNQGKTREADSLLLVYGNANEVHRGMRISVLCDRGPSPECERLLDSASASGSQQWKVLGIQLRSDLALLQGQVKRSNRMWAEWDALNRARGGSSGFGPYGSVIRANQIDAITRHRPELAAARLDSVGSPPTVAYEANMMTRAYEVSVMAEMSAAYGRLDRSRSLQQRFVIERLDTTNGPIEWFRDRLNLAKARVAFAEGRWNDALVAWNAADTWSDGPSRNQSPLGLYQFSGSVYDRAGMKDSAIVAYERYLSTPVYHRLPYDRVYRASIYERLGQLYEETRNLERARFYDGKFVELWKDADAELQPRVEGARRRIARLR